MCRSHARGTSAQNPRARRPHLRSRSVPKGDGRRTRRIVAAARALNREPRHGEIVKRLGDGLMGAFADSPSAVEAALEACERTAAIELDGFRPRLRAGVHLGRPRRIGGDYFGVDVNIAARLAQAAQPGEVLVSDRTLKELDPDAIVATRRSFKAKGAPAGLAAHAVRRLL